MTRPRVVDPADSEPFEQQETALLRWTEELRGKQRLFAEREHVFEGTRLALGGPRRRRGSPPAASPASEHSPRRVGVTGQASAARSPAAPLLAHPPAVSFAGPPTSPRHSGYASHLGSTEAPAPEAHLFTPAASSSRKKRRTCRHNTDHFEQLPVVSSIDCSPHPSSDSSPKMHNRLVSDSWGTSLLEDEVDWEDFFCSAPPKTVQSKTVNSGGRRTRINPDRPVSITHPVIISTPISQPTPTPVPAPRGRAAATQSTSTPAPVSRVGVTGVQPPPVPVPAPRLGAARLQPDHPRGPAEALQPVPSCSGGSEELACFPISPPLHPPPDPAFHALALSLVSQFPHLLFSSQSSQFTLLLFSSQSSQFTLLLFSSQSSQFTLLLFSSQSSQFTLLLFSSQSLARPPACPVCRPVSSVCPPAFCRPAFCSPVTHSPPTPVPGPAATASRASCELSRSSARGFLTRWPGRSSARGFRTRWPGRSSARGFRARWPGRSSARGLRACWPRLSPARGLRACWPRLSPARGLHACWPRLSPARGLRACWPRLSPARGFRAYWFCSCCFVTTGSHAVAWSDLCFSSCFAWSGLCFSSCFAWSGLCFSSCFAGSGLCLSFAVAWSGLGLSFAVAWSGLGLSLAWSSLGLRLGFSFAFAWSSFCHAVAQATFWTSTPPPSSSRPPTGPAQWPPPSSSRPPTRSSPASPPATWPPTGTVSALPLATWPPA
ncbi:hypothetical protein ACER0C_003551 [Sarotherodon galilaeus]